MRMRCLFFPALLLGAALAAHAEPQVAVAGGADLWSQRVAREWAPRSQAALLALQRLAAESYGVTLSDAQLHLVLQATPRAALPEGGGQAVLVEAGLDEAQLRQRALEAPLRQGLGAMVDQLVQGHGERLPAWLAPALTQALAQRIEAGLNLPPLPAYLPAAEARSAPRAAVAVLQQGSDFDAHMRAYLAAMAGDHFDAAAFRAQFGIDEAELLRQAEASSAAIPARPASAPMGTGGAGHVEVQMGGHVDDAFSAEVRDHWLPVVRQATAQFDQLAESVLQVHLSRDVRVYVGGGEQDYEQVLVQDMRVPPARAELQGEVSGGLSNNRGQIALKFTPRLKSPALYDRSVRVPLHELTHALQKQLGANYPGFKPPVWMIEGTADLMASLLARNLRIEDVEAEALRDWRLRNLEWWRHGNRTRLQPDDLLGVTHPQWLLLMKDKRGCYQMAGLMSMYLQAISGERFLPAWVAYFRSAAVRGQDGGNAFKQAFGLDEAAFVEDFKRWLVQQ